MVKYGRNNPSSADMLLLAVLAAAGGLLFWLSQRQAVGSGRLYVGVLPGSAPTDATFQAVTTAFHTGADVAEGQSPMDAVAAGIQIPRLFAGWANMMLSTLSAEERAALLAALDVRPETPCGARYVHWQGYGAVLSYRPHAAYQVTFPQGRAIIKRVDAAPTLMFDSQTAGLAVALPARPAFTCSGVSMPTDAEVDRALAGGF